MPWCGCGACVCVGGGCEVRGGRTRTATHEEVVGLCTSRCMCIRPKQVHGVRTLRWRRRSNRGLETSIQGTATKARQMSTSCTVAWQRGEVRGADGGGRGAGGAADAAQPP